MLGSAGNEFLGPHIRPANRLEAEGAIFLQPLQLLLRQVLSDFEGLGHHVSLSLALSMIIL
jgi:hypothetical protein